MSETVTTTCNKCAGTRRWYPNASGSEPCPDCREPAETPCKRCGGRGTVMVPFKWERQTMPCSVCKGTGVAPPAAVPEPCEYVYKVLTPDGVYADGEWATLEAIPAKLPDRSEHYFDTADADKNLVPVVPPAVVPEPPLAHVFVSAGRFARAGSGADWRYCNICGLVERADGTNKPCSGQFPPLSLRNDSEVLEPDNLTNIDGQPLCVCCKNRPATEGFRCSDCALWTEWRQSQSPEPDAAFEAWKRKRKEKPRQHLLRPTLPHVEVFRAGYAAAQSAQRAALAGLVEDLDARAVRVAANSHDGPCEPEFASAMIKRFADELRALLEGKSE